MTKTLLALLTLALTACTASAQSWWCRRWLSRG
jgi:hypothetical protein